MERTSNLRNPGYFHDCCFNSLTESRSETVRVVDSKEDKDKDLGKSKPIILELPPDVGDYSWVILNVLSVHSSYNDTESLCTTGSVGEALDDKWRVERHEVAKWICMQLLRWQQTHKLAINGFADQPIKDSQSHAGFKRTTTTSSRHKNITDIPTAVDWRKRRAVTPVKNQRGCVTLLGIFYGGCNRIEGIQQIISGNLVSFSEQQLVDCVTSNWTNGCNGGNKIDAFKFILENGGIATEASYPYKGVKMMFFIMKCCFIKYKY
ncbi:papain family cysteine protease [Medicago truncatula]|uniref:Papain family cysteine protease n=1 Tax=Medicago truncatula TaxID=3880 RepID=A2Q4E7_MEDTR|nr:Peptidase C1A, papain [Medicago truncatula]AES80235.1 papain family cysteine protease [Medicago truncatula]